MNPLWRYLSARLAELPLLLIVLITVVSGAGFMMLYSSAGGALMPWALPQMIRFAVGMVLMVVMALMPIRFWMRYAYWLYAGVVVLLIGVEVMGHIGMGAQRWISLGGVKLQPSELAKLTVILALARYFHHFPPTKYTGVQYLLMPALLLAVPVVLILKQPNLGTATLLTGIAVWMLFAAGVHWRYFAIGLVCVAVALPVGWQYLHGYQKQRVLTFLSPETDPLGAGYNITQSMIAIGSGGLTGKGLMQGSQTQLDFLPEKQTDFIFTVLAEEFGFMGGALLILSFTAMVLFIIGIAYRSVSLFGSLVAHGIAAMLTLHLFINVGMVMGILPVVGIPLPLFSYGGSIMISILCAFGLAINAWVYRDDRCR
jgi:rod shape determining protein RodA